MIGEGSSACSDEQVRQCSESDETLLQGYGSPGTEQRSGHGQRPAPRSDRLSRDGVPAGTLDRRSKRSRSSSEYVGSPVRPGEVSGSIRARIRRDPRWIPPEEIEPMVRLGAGNPATGWGNAGGQFKPPRCRDCPSYVNLRTRWRSTNLAPGTA